MHDLKLVEPCQIRARQERAFAELMRRVLETNGFYREKYDRADVPLQRQVGISDLTQLPFTTIDELTRDLTENGPDGTNLTHPRTRYIRRYRAAEGAAVACSFDTAESSAWWVDCWSSAIEAAAIERGHRVYLPLSTAGLAAWAAQEAVQQSGGLVEVAVDRSAEEHVRAMVSSGTDVLIADLERVEAMIEASRGMGLEIEAMPSKVLVHGLPVGISLGAPLRRRFKRWQSACFPVALDHHIGAWAHGCGRSTGMHLQEAEFIFEVIDPGDGSAAEPDKNGAQRGELVVTNLGRPGNPVIRLRTGVRVVVGREACRCGAVTRRLEAWSGEDG
ncbi:hypothetical protein ABI59_15535 [Acidobacteria bacterium Mor1]|nr:hypothetical protein ABI59_15535 [Acidobacteria bacterium Mor1]